MKFHYLFRSTYKPTGHTYMGIHSSDDPNFGSEYYHDAFIGSGARFKEFIKALQAMHHLTAPQIRSNFVVEVLLGGTFEQCKHRYDQFDIPYTHPLCLNLKEGAPSGVPKTPEHIEAMSSALKEAMKGNSNVVGTVKVTEDGDAITPEVREAIESTKHKIKWINNKIESKSVALPIDSEGRVIVPEGWVLGQLRNKLKEESTDE